MAPASGTGGCLRRRPAPGGWAVSCRAGSSGRRQTVSVRRRKARSSSVCTEKRFVQSLTEVRSGARRQDRRCRACSGAISTMTERRSCCSSSGDGGGSEKAGRSGKPDRTGAGRSILISTTGRERTFARPGWPRISVWMPPRGSLTNSSGLSSPNGADGKAHGTGSAGGLSELHNGIGAEQEE